MDVMKFVLKTLFLKYACIESPVPVSHLGQVYTLAQSSKRSPRYFRILIK